MARKPPESAKKHLYFIQAVPAGPIKIGVSSCPEARLTQLQVASSVKLALLASVPGDQQHEKFLHRMLHGSRQEGEWFRPTPELLALVAKASKAGGLSWGELGLIEQERKKTKPIVLDVPFSKLADYREKLGLSQAAAALEIGISASALCSAELGRRFPDPHTLLKIMEFSLDPGTGRSHVTANDIFETWAEAHRDQVRAVVASL